MLFISYISIFIWNIYIIFKRYYSGLYGDEGYFINKLPTNKMGIISRKLLVGVLWVAISCAIVFTSYYFLTSSDNNVIREVLKENNLYVNGKLNISLIMIILLTGLSSLITYILAIYSSISISSIIKKNNKLYLVIILISHYVLIKSSRSSISAKLNTTILNGGNRNNIIMLISFSVLAYAIISLIFFSVSNYLLEKKLNLN